MMSKKKKWKNGQKKSSRASKKRLMESKEGYNLYASNYQNDEAFLDTFEENDLFRMIGDVSGKKILDIGVGTGRILNLLFQKNSEVWGIDVSEGMLKIAKDRFPQLNILEGDFRDLPFKDEEFDFLISTFVLVHIRELKEAFLEAYRVLKVGGEILITNINQRKAPELIVSDKESIIINSFYHRPQDVISALEYAFFQIEEEKIIREGKTWITQLVKAVKH